MQKGRFTRTGMLNRLLDILLIALTNLQTKYLMENHEFSKYLSEIVRRYLKIVIQFINSKIQHDLLYDAEYNYSEKNVTYSQYDANK
jgi:hypothetical protein